MNTKLQSREALSEAATHRRIVSPPDCRAAKRRGAAMTNDALKQRSTPGMMKTILVPIDFSPITRKVVAEAVNLARLVVGQLVLIHVVQPPAFVTDYDFMAESVPLVLETLERSAARQLHRWKRRLEARGLTPAIVKRSGPPALLIVEEAKRRPADYIVIGSHGHTAFHDLLIGSTTSGVLKKAPCPVMIIPACRAGRKSRA